MLLEHIDLQFLCIENDSGKNNLSRKVDFGFVITFITMLEILRCGTWFSLDFLGWGLGFFFI